jgi:hypothetical protein
MDNKTICFNNYSFRLFQLMIGITFLLFLTNSTAAQESDSSSTFKKLSITDSIKTDSLKIRKYHSPKKAAIFSMILPGLGQAYNKKYWKIPVVYAAAGGLMYSFQFNQSRYIKYRNAYSDRLNGIPDDYIGKYSNDQLNTLFKYYNRYRDLTVIGFAALYAINIIDASVDAHLFTFDVSDDLSFNIHPTLINTANVNHYTTALSLNIKF